MGGFLVNGYLVLFLSSSLLICKAGAILPLFAEIVPPGVESVNGSSVNMGCLNPLDYVGNLKCCARRRGSQQHSLSYLSDKTTPDIHTDRPDWASRLLTVRKNHGDSVISFDHVILTFGFDVALTPYNIELDLFRCPEWKIDAPFISVYASDDSDMVFREGGEMDFLAVYRPTETSCNNLTRVSVRLSRNEPSYHFWHVVVSFQGQEDIEWVHVGEVRFLEVEMAPSSSVVRPILVQRSIERPVSPTKTVLESSSIMSTTATLSPSASLRQSLPPAVTSTATMTTTTEATPTGGPAPMTTASSMERLVPTTTATIGGSVAPTASSSHTGSFSSGKPIVTSASIRWSPTMTKSSSEPATLFTHLTTVTTSRTLSLVPTVTEISAPTHTPTSSLASFNASKTLSPVPTATEIVTPTNTPESSTTSTMVLRETEIPTPTIMLTSAQPPLARTISPAPSETLIPTVPTSTLTSSATQSSIARVTTPTNMPPSSTVVILTPTPEIATPTTLGTSQMVENMALSITATTTNPIVTPAVWLTTSQSSTIVDTLSSLSVTNSVVELASNVPPSLTTRIVSSTTTTNSIASVEKATPTRPATSDIVTTSGKDQSIDATPVNSMLHSKLATPIVTVALTPYSEAEEKPHPTNPPISENDSVPTVLGEKFPGEDENISILSIVAAVGMCILVVFVLCGIIGMGVFYERRKQQKGKGKRKGPESGSEQEFIINPIYQPHIGGGSSRRAMEGSLLVFNLYKYVNPDTLSLHSSLLHGHSPEDSLSSSSVQCLVPSSDPGSCQSNS